MIDKSTGILVGIAGAGLAAILGCGIYYSKKSKEYQSFPTQSKLPLTDVRSTEGDLFDWKNKYNVKYITMVDTVLYNTVDSLSLYGYSNPDVFLDLVHCVEQYSLIYLNSQQTPKNPEWINMSSQMQTKLFNIVGELEKCIKQHYTARNGTNNTMNNFSERSQVLINLINSYHVNIIRQINSK